MTKVLPLAVGEHFDVVDAADAHQLECHPVAVGQSIDQVLVIGLQHIVAALPEQVIGQVAMLVLHRVEEIIITVDSEYQLVEVERIVGTVLHAQPQWPGQAILLQREDEIYLVAGLVG